jgi:hypothetical protein
MDNFGKGNIGDDTDKLVPPSDGLDKPIPFDDGDAGGSKVLHSPLNLGGSGTVKAPAGPAAPSVKPTVKAATGKGVSSSDRVTGVKTFFAKLQPGSINFLDEQINNWLRENPGVVIKRTNTVTGEVQGKQTEPNIIITVWY